MGGSLGIREPWKDREKRKRMWKGGLGAGEEAFKKLRGMWRDERERQRETERQKIRRPG